MKLNTVKKSNKKKRSKKSKKSSWSARLASARALIATLAIGVLSAFGLMRCFDEKQASPIDPVKPRQAVRVRQVDVGKGKTADPTLVNEERLLKQETQPKVQEKVEKEAPKAQKAAVAENKVPEAENKVSEEEEKTQEKDTQQEAEESPEEALSQEERFPLYGVAFHFHTQFKAEPKNDSRVIAYARRGASFRVSERISTNGCKNGWYEIAPGDLFACANQGIIVGRTPVSFAPSPPAPDKERPLPYDYAYVTADNTPQYWRIPSESEIAETAAFFAASAPADTDSTARPTAESPLAAASSSDTAAAAAAPVAEEKVAETKDAGVTEEKPDDSAEGEEENAFPDYLHMRMARGYYVSLDDEVEANSHKYRRTVRGRIIPADRLAPARPSDFEGFLISDPAILPQVIIVGSGVRSLRQKVKDGPLEKGTPVAHLSRFDYLGEIKRNKRTYIQIGDGQFVSERVAAVIRPQKVPSDVRPNERWIDVDLSEQVLTAYEEDRPVFATVVSTGRAGFPTPTGEFHVYAKHMTVTMDDTEAGAEAYSIEDVPWVQYFKDSYALHGVFWHGRFGRVRSHGCVNLSPKDAKRLFAWTGPAPASGIHGQFATRNNPGTRIVIHK